jgi:hypothetical protein
MMTANFVDLMIIDTDTVTFLFTIFPALRWIVALNAIALVPLLALAWWFDTIRVQRVTAFSLALLCLGGLTALAKHSPMEPFVAYYGGNHVSNFARSGVDAVSEFGREFSHALLSAVVSKPEPELGSALDRLTQSGLLFRQGVPPHATFLFKHALVQDVAYGTLLREPRRALHARIAEAIESQFAEIVERQPELLARHCTEAGLIEKATGFWGKAGQRSLERSALVEATAQLTRALDQIATLPTTPVLRREQIKLELALANALMHTRGYAAPDTTASIERARSYIERAEALGEAPEDPLLLFSVLYGSWVANYIAFNGDAIREFAAQFLMLAEQQRAAAPLMVGHCLVGTSLLFTGDIAQGRAHYGAHADLGKIDDAWRCIRDALAMIDETKESVWEADANRMAGEIALKPPQRDETKAQAYFERALEVAAPSFERCSS